MVLELIEKHLWAHERIIQCLVREGPTRLRFSRGREGATGGTRCKGRGLVLAIGPFVVFQMNVDVGALRHESHVVDKTNAAGVTESDSLSIARDPKLFSVQAAEND